jgi:hypothetical protein
MSVTALSILMSGSTKNEPTDSKTAPKTARKSVFAEKPTRPPGVAAAEIHRKLLTIQCNMADYSQKRNTEENFTLTPSVDTTNPCHLLFVAQASKA